MSSLTWGGSLVGATNPDQKLGYSGAKRGRDGEVLPDPDALPSSVVVELSAASTRDSTTTTTADAAFPPIDVPIGTSVPELESLVNSLMNGNNEDEEDGKSKKETTPYAFYLSRSGPGREDDEDLEISSTLLEVGE